MKKSRFIFASIMIVVTLIIIAFITLNERMPTLDDRVSDITQDVLIPILEQAKPQATQGSKTPVSSNQSITPLAEEEKQRKELASQANKIGLLYGDLLCMLSNPKFWEDFFDEFWDGNQSELDRLTEEAKMQYFYRAYGFNNEGVAMKAVEKHWGSDVFKLAVKETVSDSEGCLNHLSESDISLDDHLAQPR